MVDSGATALWAGSTGPPLAESLEGQLLEHWDGGSPAYDALLLRALPPKLEWATGACLWGGRGACCCNTVAWHNQPTKSAAATVT